LAILSTIQDAPCRSRALLTAVAIPKQHHRVTNGAADDAGLRGRGSLTVWFTDAAIAGWRAEPRTIRGGQPYYSDLAIATALPLRAVFRLALRQTKGLIRFLIALLGLDLLIPDHSTLSRRAETLEVPRPSTGTTSVHLLVDSTGLRLCRPGEWLVERFNGQVGSEVLCITIYSHSDLEQLLRGFNAAYNARRQCVLNGKTPNQVVTERLKARRNLANPKPHGRAGPDDIIKSRLIVEAAKEVSQPDS